MPNVDDHGLEVLKKAARNIGSKPKEAYAIEVAIVADESQASPPATPKILNVPIVAVNTEQEIVLPPGTKSFILKSRQIARLRLAYEVGETEVAWIEIPPGGYHTENTSLALNKIYLQSDNANSIIEIVAY